MPGRPTIEMLVRSRITARAYVLGAFAALALAGCGSPHATSGDGASPQSAVTTFLAPLRRTSTARITEPERRRRAVALWKTMCDRVDPAIRRGLRVNDEVTIPDAHTACGAVIVLMVLNTPENAGIAPPATITGTPRAASTNGNTSIVTADVHYEPMANATAPPPPARATIKVLVVKRDGRWWVATPDAFNATHASRGGLTEPQLRRSYLKLLAAAR